MKCLPALLLLFIISLISTVGDAQAQNGSFQDPIAYTGHGAIFGHDGKEIKPTPEFLAETQAAYIEALLGRVDPKTQEGFEQYREAAYGAAKASAATDRDLQYYQFRANARLLRFLAGRTEAGNKIPIHAGALNRLIDEVLFPAESPSALPRALEDMIDAIPEPQASGSTVLFSTFNAGQAYIDECAANGVPIPPNWGSSQWSHVGNLTDAQEFISGGAEARVYKYKSTGLEGTCIALPRFMGNGSGDIALLGIICLGKQTSKACFWDNQMNNQTFTIGASESKPLSAFGGGAELAKTDEFGQTAGGVCTSCHAGENPYVMHPSTALSQGSLGDVILQADNWYDPLVHPDWPQNAGPSVAVPAIAGIGECTGCHNQTGAGPNLRGGRFPQLSNALAGYCGTILRLAVARTMPVGAPGSSQTSSHVNAMLDLCDSVATPMLRIETALIDYGEVEMGFSFAKALALHNDGNANLTVSVTRTTPSGDPNLAHWDEVNELATVTIAPGDPPVVLRQVYEPQAVGMHTIELEVVNGDAAAPATTVLLTGEGILPRPIDTLLVLDRSGSMDELAGDRTKIEAMRNAVMLYTDLLRPGAGDQLGFVKYNKNNSVYMPMTTISGGVQNAIEVSELSGAAIIDLSRLKPDGRTGIGGAMLTGAAEVGGPFADRGSVMVVLTDGKENEDPSIADAIADIQANDPHIQMYSVGLGFDIEPTKLQNITNMGPEGYHQVVNAQRDETLFDLETFYFKIFASATNMDMVTDPTHVINLTSLTPVVVDRARVISSDRNATFVVLDDPQMRSLYSLRFIAPNGVILSAGSTVGGIPIHERTRNTYRIFRIVFPDQSQASTYVGDWTVELVPRGSWNPAVGKKLAAASRFGYGGVMHPAQGRVPIGFAGAVSSDYHLEAGITPNNYLPGAEIRLDAALTDRGWPAPDGTVTVTITRPDLSVRTVTLHDDGLHRDGAAGDAAWANYFAETGIQGVYKVLFRSVGRNERGELAPRLVLRYVTLQRPEPPLIDPGDGPGDGGGGCDACEGDAAAYLIGSYDLRHDSRTLIKVLNPTAAPLELVISLFDHLGQPLQCVRDKIGPNALREFDIRRLEPRVPHGVIKIVSFAPGSNTPTLGIVGDQIRIASGGLSETALHPVSRRILAKDLKRILATCH
ncbi:MAG: VWA domain-containing protein [Alphaproteobacteria bacterium]|nr:VWA domain-containing protein [Alphaproteobacteria bacterium]